MKQRIIIYLDGDEQIEKISEYEKDYELNRDVISLGVNGVTRKNEENDTTEYFPPHRIVKIEVKKI